MRSGLRLAQTPTPFKTVFPIAEAVMRVYLDRKPGVGRKSKQIGARYRPTTGHAGSGAWAHI
jgi:hypothetical protein